MEINRQKSICNGNFKIDLTNDVKSENQQDYKNINVEDEIDIIEIISNSTPEPEYLPFLPSTDNPDEILDVSELLKETIKDVNGKNISIFSYGPWPKVKKFENQLRPINCHICRYTTVKREEMKNHINRQRHIRRLKTDFNDKYFKPMKNFYDFNENKIAILFCIKAGENIKEVTNNTEYRLIEYKKDEDLKICLKLAKYDKLYDLNEENPILGLEYCIKLTQSNEIDEYYCVLCEELFYINNVNHFLNSAHQNQYINKHFDELSKYCLKLLEENINNKDYCKEKMRDILVDFYRKIEIGKGFRHICTLEKNIFNEYQSEYIEKINKLMHYSDITTESSKNTVIDKILNNFIRRSLYMKPQFQRKRNENISVNNKENKEKELRNLQNQNHMVILNLQVGNSSKNELSQPEKSLISLSEKNNVNNEDQTTKVQNNIGAQGAETNIEQTELTIEPDHKNESVKNIAFRNTQEIIGKINKVELKDFSSENVTKITENVLENSSATSYMENEKLEIKNSEKNNTKDEENNIIENIDNKNSNYEINLNPNMKIVTKQTELTIEPDHKNESVKNIAFRNTQEIIGKINKVELKDFSSENVTKITENVLENSSATSYMENEKLEIKNSEKNLVSFFENNIIENIDNKNSNDEINLNPNTKIVTKNNISDIDEIVTSENVSIVENMDITNNSIEDHRIKDIDEIVNSENAYVSMDISKISIDEHHLNNMNIEKTIESNKIYELNSVNLKNSNHTECTTNSKETENATDKKTNSNLDSSTDSQIKSKKCAKISDAISGNTKSEITAFQNDKNHKRTVSNKYTTINIKNAPTNFFEQYNKYTIIQDNKETPIFSSAPSTSKSMVISLQCHVCSVSVVGQNTNINEHIKGQKHKKNLKLGIFKNPIRYYYKTINNKTKVFYDIYAGEYISDESEVNKKVLYYKYITPTKSNSKKSNSHRVKNKSSEWEQLNKSVNINKNDRKKELLENNNKINSNQLPEQNNSYYKIFSKEFPPEIIEEFLSLKIQFENNNSISIFSFGPIISIHSTRTINCHLCNHTMKTLPDLKEHTKTTYHQHKKNTIKWIELKKPMKLFYKIENNINQYFLIWPGENIYKVNLESNGDRIINANQILVIDNDNDKIYENIINKSIMGLEYGIKLKNQTENFYFCLLCNLYLLSENSEYLNHFNGEKHHLNYINKHFGRYKEKIYNKINIHFSAKDIKTKIILNINLDIYKKMEQYFGYRKMYSTSLINFKQNFQFFTADEFDLKIIHYNDSMNLLIDSEILKIIEDSIISFDIPEIKPVLKRKENNLSGEPPPKRYKFDSSNGNVSLISVFRLLSIIEDDLGRLGIKVLEILGKAALCEKNNGNLIQFTTNNNIYMLIITINEKLKGLLQAQLIESQKTSVVKRLLNEIPILIEIMDEDKKKINIQTVSSTKTDNHICFGDNWFYSLGNIDNDANTFENLGVNFNNIEANTVSQQINNNSNEYNILQKYNKHISGREDNTKEKLRRRINELLRKPDN